MYWGLLSIQKVVIRVYTCQQCSGSLCLIPDGDFGTYRHGVDFTDTHWVEFSKYKLLSIVIMRKK